MQQDKKEKLIRYLFPNENLRNFMCNDLYPELISICPKKLFISSKNKTLKYRKENLKSIKTAINTFIEENTDYRHLLQAHYLDKTTEEVIDILVIGLTFYLANTIKSSQDLDIFHDKKSVCYSPISIIDLY